LAFGFDEQSPGCDLIQISNKTLHLKLQLKFLLVLKLRNLMGLVGTVNCLRQHDLNCSFTISDALLRVGFKKPKSRKHKEIASDL
jgi:hypothetical protein